MLILSFLALSAAWGGSFLFMRQADPAFGPLALILLRAGIAALLLSPAAWASRGELRRQWRTVLLLGALNCALPFSLLAWSLRVLPAGHDAILNALSPLWVALVGQLFFRQPQGPRVWLGLGLALLGVGVTLEPWRDGLSPQLLPTLAAVAATLCYGFATHVARRLNHLPPAAVAWAAMAGGAVWMLAPGLLTWPASPPTLSSWASVLALGAVCTAAAYSIYYRLLQQWGPLPSVLVTYVVPFFGLLWGWLFLGEAARQGWWGGFALVLAGLALAREPKK